MSVNGKEKGLSESHRRRRWIKEPLTGLLIVAVGGFAMLMNGSCGGGKGASSFTNTLGSEFVPVTGLPGVLFGKCEVTNGEFRQFKPGHNSKSFEGQSLNMDRQPVVNVSWEEAKEFCNWLTNKERGEGKIKSNEEYRLPYDWEWSVAVGLQEDRSGTPKSKDRKIADVYPWGTQWPPPQGEGNYAVMFGVDTYPVASLVGVFGAKTNGLCDMSGNVWEHCEDLYDPSMDSRVARGGSWFFSGSTDLLSSVRSGRPPYFTLANVGFRCVLASSQ